MFDLRARIGLMVPSLNTAMEPELHMMAPEGVALYAARMHIEATTEEKLAEMAAFAENAARDLGDTDPDILLYGCTSGSFIKGNAWERDLVARCEKASGVKVITTSGAILRALKAVNAKKVCIATPYIDEVNILGKRFFEENGIEVLAIEGMGRAKKGEIRAVSYQEVYRLAKSVIRPDAEALVLSCTEMRTVRILQQLETDLKIPVISSNQADLWAALRECGLDDEIFGYGKLFSC